MIAVDITADLNDEDETGFVWTFLDEARDPSIIVPGAIVMAGDADAPAVAEVVDLVEKPSGSSTSDCFRGPWRTTGPSCSGRRSWPDTRRRRGR